jgi:hypothetical protein
LQMRQRPHHASSLPNDRRALRLVQLVIAEHENPGQLLMQAEFCSVLRNCKSAPFYRRFSQRMTKHRRLSRARSGIMPKIKFGQGRAATTARDSAGECCRWLSDPRW